MKAFTKGQRVTIIGNWDQEGTYFYRHAVVRSCGLKELLLNDAETGEALGGMFRPVVGTDSGVLPGMTDEQAAAHCMQSAAKFLVEAQARLERMIVRAETEQFADWKGYVSSLHRGLRQLHEPRTLKRPLA